MPYALFLGKFECLGHLGLVGVLFTVFVEFQLCQHFTAKFALGEHPADRFAEDEFRFGFHPFPGCLGTKARPTGVPGVFFLVEFFAAENDFIDVCDNNVIAGVDMRRVSRAVFPHKNHRNITCQPPDDLVGPVNHPPVLLDLIRFRHIRFVHFANLIIILMTIVSEEDHKFSL